MSMQIVMETDMFFWRCKGKRGVLGQVEMMEIVKGKSNEKKKLKCIKIYNKRRESSQSKSESIRQEDNMSGIQTAKKVEAE